MSTFKPDHNGECLNCDEWLDAHSLDGTCPTDPGQAVANQERYWQDKPAPLGDLSGIPAGLPDEQGPTTRPDYLGIPRTPAPSITCPFCGFVSYNPNDIRERYCGGCKRFQEPEKP